MKNDPIIRYILHNQIIEALLLIALFWFVFEMRNIFVALFISYIIMAALTPLVELFRSFKIPQTLAVAISYIGALFLVVVLIVPLVPFFIAQIQSLFVNLPTFLDKAAQLIGVDINNNQLERFVNAEFGGFGKNAVLVTSKVFGGLFSLLTILVVSFYLMLEHKKVKQSISNLFPAKHQEDALTMLIHIEEKLGAWLRGQMILSLFIGIITWVALTIIGVEYALPLALIAGILEIIPTIGPIIASVPAIIVALNVSPALALLVAGIYLGIQLIENNFLVPKIMQKAVGLNPLVIIIGVIIGGELMGFVGALLSIPFIAMLVIIVHSIKKFEQ